MPKPRAAHVLQTNWESVQETASALLEHETLSGVGLDAVLSAVTPIEVSELWGITRPRVSGWAGLESGQRPSEALRLQLSIAVISHAGRARARGSRAPRVYRCGRMPAGASSSPRPASWRPVQGSAGSAGCAVSRSTGQTPDCSPSRATRPSPRGLFFYDGQSWHELSTVCGDTADSSRIAWAGP